MFFGTSALFGYTSFNYTPCVNMYRMYSPCCAAQQAIVSETLKHSVTLWSGSILGAPGGDGSAQGKGKELPPLGWGWFLHSWMMCWAAPLGWVLLLSTAEPPAGDWEAKKPSRICCHLPPTAPWSQRNQEQTCWSRGGGWQGLLLALSLGDFTLFLCPS